MKLVELGLYAGIGAVAVRSHSNRPGKIYRPVERSDTDSQFRITVGYVHHRLHDLQCILPPAVILPRSEMVGSIFSSQLHSKHERSISIRHERATRHLRWSRSHRTKHFIVQLITGMGGYLWSCKGYSHEDVRERLRFLWTDSNWCAEHVSLLPDQIVIVSRDLFADGGPVSSPTKRIIVASENCSLTHSPKRPCSNRKYSCSPTSENLSQLWKVKLRAPKRDSFQSRNGSTWLPLIW